MFETSDTFAGLQGSFPSRGAQEKGKAWERGHDVVARGRVGPEWGTEPFRDL